MRRVRRPPAGRFLTVADARDALGKALEDVLREPERVHAARLAPSGVPATG